MQFVFSSTMHVEYKSVISSWKFAEGKNKDVWNEKYYAHLKPLRVTGAKALYLQELTICSLS